MSHRRLSGDSTSSDDAAQSLTIAHASSPSATLAKSADGTSKRKLSEQSSPTAASPGSRSRTSSRSSKSKGSKDGLSVSSDPSPEGHGHHSPKKNKDRESRKSSAALLPIIRSTSASNLIGSPSSYKPTSPLIEKNHTADWLIEEPTKEVEEPILKRYRHLYAEDYFEEPHVNYILVQTLHVGEKKETSAKAIVSILKGPEKTQINKFLATGNTHRVLVQHETGFEEIGLHNFPTCSDEELPAKFETHLKANLASKDISAYLIAQNTSDVKADILALESKHSRQIKFMKIAVLYAKPGQTNIDAIWKNSPPTSSAFFNFLNSISTTVNLENWEGYRGDMGNFGVDAKSSAFYRKWNDIEILFHVAPWMDEEQHRRLCGNDVGVLIFFDSTIETKSSASSGSTKIPNDEKQIDKRLIQDIFKEIAVLESSSMLNLSKNFFKILFEKSEDAKDYFNDTVGTSEWRMNELLKKMFDFISRFADDDVSITAKVISERKNFYMFLGVDPKVFDAFSAALITALKHAFNETFTTEHIDAWKYHLGQISKLFLGQKEFTAKRSPSYVPFDFTAMGSVPQVFAVVDPHPTEKSLHRLAFFQRPGVGSLRHYFSPESLSDFLYTKFHNGFMQANNIPPFDRLFSVPRREAIKHLAEKYPRLKSKKERRHDSDSIGDFTRSGILTVTPEEPMSITPVKAAKSSTMKMITGSFQNLKDFGRDKERDRADKEKERPGKDRSQDSSDNSDDREGGKQMQYGVFDIKDYERELTDEEKAIADLLSNPASH